MRESGTRKRAVAIMLAALLLMPACTTPGLIHDSGSSARQKQISRNRAGNVAGDIFLTVGSAVVGALTGIYVGYSPSGQRLKKISLENESTDTLQVNMLTDQLWKDSVFCDFLDVRIPPGETCRLLVPYGSVYHLYFSDTPGTPEDDEFIQLETAAKRKIRLTPGMTQPADTLRGLEIPIP